MPPPSLSLTLLLVLSARQAFVAESAPASSAAAWTAQPSYQGWIDYPSDDGLLVHAYLFKPEGRGPFKLFVYTPGGGKGTRVLNLALTLHRLGRFEPFLQAGYVVMVPAYRGASDFGPEYQAAFDYGGREAEDVMAGARYLLTRQLVSPNHVYFSGISHGAKITMMVAQRSRLATAVAPISGDYDISSAVAGQRTPGYCEALQPPMRVPVMRQSILKDHPSFSDDEIVAEARRRDPLLHVDQVQCPVFQIAAEHDYTVGLYVAARMKNELIRHHKTFIDKMYRGPDTIHSLPDRPGEAAAELWKDIFDFCEGRSVAATGTIPLEAMRPDYPQPRPPARSAPATSTRATGE